MNADAAACQHWRPGCSAPTDTVELICIDFIGMYRLDLERAAAAVKMSYVLQRVSISRASAI